MAEDLRKTGTGGSIWSRPTVEDDKIFFTSLDHRLYCLNTEGNLLWNFRTGDRILSSPSAVDGKIFFGSMDRNIYAVTKDGKQIWKFLTGDSVYCEPVIHKGVVYCGSMDGHMYALNCENGRLIWKFKTGGEIGSGVAIIGNKLVFGSYDNYVYCLDHSGSLLWKYYVGAEVNLVGYLPAVYKDTIFMHSANMYINALNIRGELRWRHRLNGPAFFDVFKDKLYVSVLNGELLALSPETGAAKLLYRLPAKGHAIACDGKNFYVSCVTGDLYSISQTGRLVAKEYITDFLVYPIVNNGVLYGGGHLCYFYAIDPDAMGINWRFLTSNPMPSEWRQVGFETKPEETEKKRYEKRITLTSEKIEYIEGKPVAHEQKFETTYSSGATTYFKAGVYAAGGSVEYGTKKKKPDWDNR